MTSAARAARNESVLLLPPVGDTAPAALVRTIDSSFLILHFPRLGIRADEGLGAIRTLQVISDFLKLRIHKFLCHIFSLPD